VAGVRLLDDAIYLRSFSPAAAPTAVAGRTWQSATRPSPSNAPFASTIPTPPARRTTSPFAAREFTPRSHTTILPRTAAGSSAPSRHMVAEYPSSDADDDAPPYTSVPPRGDGGRVGPVPVGVERGPGLRGLVHAAGRGLVPRGEEARADELARAGGGREGGAGPGRDRGRGSCGGTGRCRCRGPR
jgi:hypothetical protein